MYKVEVIADSSNVWTGNAMRFAAIEDAEIYAKDLFSRWTAVRSYRVVELDDNQAVVKVVLEV